MKIISIQALRGPNVWSTYRRKLIQMRLDLEDLEERPTNTIDGFYERLKELIPTLHDHECSEGHAGGFFERVKDGTWMGHVIEHIALEIQTLAGMETGFGRTRSTREHGVYNVVFSYVEEKVGVYAAKAAVSIAQSLIDNTEYNIEEDIQRMREIREDVRLGPSTGSIVDEAIKRNIPFIRLNNSSLVQLGYGVNQRRIQATITGNTSHVAVEIASDKQETKNLLRQASIPVAAGDLCYDQEDLRSCIEDIGYPIVIKPLDGNHGKGATINIKSWDEAVGGFEYAKQYSRRVIVERFVEGHDFRVLVVNHKIIAAAKREPAHVVGDGTNSIGRLIEITNEDPRRGYGHEKVLTEISVDRDTEELLTKAGLTLESVPKSGEKVYLKSTANLSTGGTSKDVTDYMHPDNIFMCERISRIIGLDVCGIDIMAQNLREPLSETGGAILEVNAAPGFRMHLAPSEGTPRNVAEPVIDMLFPPGTSSRIPIFSVTGTNGKTTTTRLLAHMVKNSGFKVGYTTTDGIYIQNQLVQKGDTTGPQSAEFILKDPTVEFAVLETARGGILRAGLGYTQSDIGIITNIAEDHLGLSDVHTLEDLADVKSVVVRTVKKEGWAILNADDEQCVRIARELECNVAYFTLNPNNPIVQEHCMKGGVSALLHDGNLIICKGQLRVVVEKAINVPLTVEGKVKFMIANALAASLAGYLYGFRLEDIRSSLATFLPGATQTPGRMNIFDFKKFKVLIDFAHNPAGYLGIEDFLRSVECQNCIGIISGIGDRRDEDIRECGRIAGRMFDHIIIRQEKNLRGRTEDEIIDLLLEGMFSSNPDISYEVIPKEVEAIAHAINIAKDGTFVVALSDVVTNAIGIVKEYLDKYQAENIPHTPGLVENAEHND